PLFPVVDFADTPQFASAGGFAVDTGTGTPPVLLDMNGPVIHAQGSLELDVKGVVALEGNFAFELGPTQNVNLANGGMDTVTTMTIGASNVNGFIGWDGPAFQFDAHGNPTDHPDAKGISLTNVSVGIFVGLSTQNLTNPAAYFAMNLSIGSL